MTFPPPHPSAQSSIASGTDKSSSTRTDIGAWGRSVSQSGARRGLTPLATNISSAAPATASRGLDAGLGVSTPSSFSAVLSSARGLSGGSPKHTSSPFTSLQSGSQQHAATLSSPKFRAHTPSIGSHLASATGSTPGGGGTGGGGGGPGSSRGVFSPLSSGTTVNSPTGFASDKPGSTAAHSSQSSLTKISIAQVFLLLDSITEKEGKEKWETKAAQIHKLVTSNGMEVFSKYFRRLLTGNAPQIFPGVNKSVENAGNYPLLVQELQKVSSDMEQAQKIAETVDTSEGDIFRDFDLSTFLDHFRLDPVVKVALALAFKLTSKSDLRAKADAILSNSLGPFLQSMASPNEVTKDYHNSFLGMTIERFILYPPRNFTDDVKAKLVYAANLRYQKLGLDMPFEVSSALQMFNFVNPQYLLVRQLHAKGGRATANIETIRELLNSDQKNWSEEHLASALLFMILSQYWEQFSLETFLSAYTDKPINWPLVFRHFDREGLRVDPKQFTKLCSVLSAVAVEDSSLDVQKLWGGDWEHRDTQMSFLTAFVASRIDPSHITNLRTTFPTDFFEDASDIVKLQGERAAKSPLRSMDAMKAIFDLALFSQASWAATESQLLIKAVVQFDLPVFLVSALAVPQPWSSVQQSFVLRTFIVFISKQEDGYQLALHGAWRQDRQWVSEQLFTTFTQDPTSTAVIYEHAAAYGWLDYLLGFTNGLALDLACYSHRKSSFDLEQWVRTAAQKGAIDMGGLLSKFLRIKAEDELHVQRKEQSAHQMVSLAVKTVYTLLSVLEEYVGDRENLTPVQRICIQTYPRLINYGEGFDDIIDANGENGNTLPDSIDKQMQELFGKMYHEELSLREMLELMRKYKSSRDPTEQDLFACMVHGLIDEYHCYHEYPLEALTKTAVMFGGIINFRLVDGITLKVGLGMILEAVREHEPHDPMYKFGVEAIEQLINRLPEWAGFCHLLFQIPSLQGTPIHLKAEEVLREQGNQIGEAEAGPFDGITSVPLTNGNSADSLMADGSVRKFRAVQLDPPLRSEVYEDPDEDIQDKILFVLNNVSEQNIDEKLEDLREVLRDQHHQWFAAYLVEERAKLQPNFQQLYLDLLGRIGDKTLWAEVLRETYVSVAKLINSEGTLSSSTDRGHLKNLGAWLGSLTIAKDKPIKHKNIYFKGLLLEGYDTQRLMVTIPFTCKVLVQATKSTVFKPPNPWLMDILGLLLELYHFAELKLNLKFEIEVLCKDLDLDHKAIEPAIVIRDRAAHAEEPLPSYNAPEGLTEPFEDMSLSSINPTIRNERLSPAAIMSTLPSLDKILVLPSSASSMVDPSILKQIVHTAVERAIAEIITPVVERSVTIASISTVQLVSKDFAMEPDEERVRHAAGIMVRQLAGSLALVTCKEPLKVSMTNYIRMIQQDYSEQPMPEGLILMCVNDNLDAACGIVEKAAEEKSLPEIEKVIEPQLEARRRHQASRSNDPFIDPSMNRWGLFIPEPYRQAPGGLNKEQLAIYEEFARQSRGLAPSADATSGRQLPDVLGESYPAIPNLSTPAEQPAIPHRTPQAQSAISQMPPVQTNGFLDAQSPRERVESLVSDLQQSARSAPEEHVKDLGRDSAVLQEYNQALRSILSSTNGEELARLTSLKVCTLLYSQPHGSLEIEVLVHLLAKLCDMSSLIARYTWALLSEVDDEHMFNVPVTVALIDAGLLDIRRVDTNLTRLIQSRNVPALELLGNLMDRVLFNEEPSALRSDFSGSLDAMSQWLAEDGSVASGLEIVRKLRESGIPEVVNTLLSDQARSKRDQMEYIFSEWIGIYKAPGATDRTFHSFLQDLHNRQVMNSQEDSALFFRLSIDISVAMFEHESQNPNGSLDEAFLYIDALAKLVILLIRFQGENAGAVKASKATYFNSILSLLILVLNHHQVMRGEAFNQRVFFRLFSSILCEYSMNGLQHTEQHQGMIFALANKFLSFQPRYVPGFVYGWLCLVSHRVFMSDMLNMPDRAGWAPYCEIMQALLSYMGEQLKAANITYVAKDLYKGVLRVLLILHHDFPEFVAENHFQFCNVIPAHCAQLRNLVLSAYPSSFQKLPDPFREGLKVERIEEMREIPKIAGDIVAPLQVANVKDIIDGVLQNETISESAVQHLCEAILNPDSKDTGLFFVPVEVDVVLVNALVLYIGQQAAVEHASKDNTRSAFENSTHAALLEKIAQVLRPESRYYLLSAMANQLRYPNSHTYFFSFTILRLFGVDYSEQDDSDVRQQIIRVLLERLIVHRPHPWGLIITLQELLQNRSYSFFRLPFIQAAPEIGRLFDALLQHIQQQSPRPIA
ncbi:Ccr4-Not transcription complex subunit (NOT1), putative [Penicillium digitatum]|uniref:General negative regulator of transcription subunit 1 n=3 Tax=Penicillium digitatum TaxID=36651 RepID=K9F8W9_PEND2|nr:Ccr4-Not transcription complex subunit (NOT1), putative [Penicillium digitatum Pd1]EKV05850.1 Ccr4-Not transcription complex subunit (NOT1), putative [Penicillium digitatum PHI26]EKV17977.1 Ccr4-Not transcription complex subunit (NOT1), putative [Penicillium digitatum Pd1]QQK47014.1 Ccr4-Not transcription complex subunit (NOT1), putative [Penicillium digitatum]